MRCPSDASTFTLHPLHYHQQRVLITHLLIVATGGPVTPQTQSLLLKDLERQHEDKTVTK
jgi:hypothetical protein